MPSGLHLLRSQRDWPGHRPSEGPSPKGPDPDTQGGHQLPEGTGPTAGLPTSPASLGRWHQGDLWRGPGLNPAWWEQSQEQPGQGLGSKPWAAALSRPGPCGVGAR